MGIDRNLGGVGGMKEIGHSGWCRMMMRFREWCFVPNGFGHKGKKGLFYGHLLWVVAFLRFR